MATYLYEAVDAAKTRWRSEASQGITGPPIDLRFQYAIEAAEPFIAKHYEEKARKEVLAKIDSLHPHEVKCRCGRGDEFEWQTHLPECPRYQVGSMLAALASQEVENRG